MTGIADKGAEQSYSLVAAAITRLFLWSGEIGAYCVYIYFMMPDSKPAAFRPGHLTVSWELIPVIFLEFDLLVVMGSREHNDIMLSGTDAGAEIHDGSRGQNKARRQRAESLTEGQWRELPEAHTRDNAGWHSNRY